MRTGIAVSDIYSKYGALLLSKGQKFTDEALIELQRNNIIEKSTYEMLHNNLILTNCIKNSKTQFCHLDYNIINNVNEMVTNMLLESHKSHWWEFVKMLSNYIDWVYEHSINVALISLIIAVKLNYSAQEQMKICMGALFHDIGKLLIPKNIIQKPSSLTEEEMSIVKQHCKLGYDILRNSDLPDCCNDIVLQHHERLDGSGYPYGLSKNQITEYAKIVMVADVLDAITSYRPYKQSETMGTAIQDLKKYSDKYDQKIVGILLDL